MTTTKWDDEALRPLREAFPWLTAVDPLDLPKLWAALMLRMTDVGLVRAQRSVPGEMAEALVASYVGGTLTTSASQKGYDVITREHERIEVKALRYTDPGRNSVAEFPFGDKGFDRLIVVCFEYDMTTREAWSIASHELDPLLTKGGRAGRGRLTLGPRAKARMEHIAPSVLLASR